MRVTAGVNHTPTGRFSGWFPGPVKQSHSSWCAQVGYHWKLEHGKWKNQMSEVLLRLAKTIASRKGADPDSSYVARLHSEGRDAILKKIGEEASETIIAAKNGDNPAVVHETADLWFHTLVMLSDCGLGPEEVLAELERRFGTSGLEEKAARGRGR